MNQRRKVTVSTLATMKASQQKITMLTAYDASFAAVMDAAGLDSILVGDSLGNVVQGHDTTLSVSVEDVIYHTQCVARAITHPLLIADMPFMSYHDLASASQTAHRLIAEGGASMVKLEGGGGQRNEIIAHLAAQGVAVCGHLGLTPQWVHRFGGFKVQGRDHEAAQIIEQHAAELEQAGIQLLVLEGIPNALAARITQQLTIPTIGIGAGAEVDGQVLVLHDMLGLNPQPPRFVRDFLQSSQNIQGAIEGYIEAVQTGHFPRLEESYSN